MRTRMRMQRRLQALGLLMLPAMAAPAWAGPPVNGPRRTVETPMLWNDNQARATCPRLCAAPETWTGGWWTTVPERASVCECVAPVAAPRPPPQQVPQPVPLAVQQKRAVEAGPIWSQDDAQGKCPQVCRAPEAWNGQWWTTVQGVMSVCECVVTVAPVQTQVVYVQTEPARPGHGHDHGHPPPYPAQPAYPQQPPAYAPPPAPPAPPPPVAMTPDEFNRFLDRLRKATFKDAQLAAIQDSVSAGARWNTQQLIAVMQLLTFGDAQVKAASLMWPSVVDPQNFPDVAASMTFESDRKKLRQALGK